VEGVLTTLAGSSTVRVETRGWIGTEQNPEALEAGWDPEFLVMDVPHDPALIYRIRIGGVAGISVAA
jgi:hypothetical protein